MGKVTAIEWCHHTYNPWRGCVKVSEGCAHCYAETQSKRNPRVLGEWGATARRAPAAESYLRNAFAWDRAAADAGERRRVFCGSLMDVFEVRADLHEHRARLFDTIAETPNLDWLLLTKRPEQWEQCMLGTLAQLPNLSGPAERLVVGWLAAYYAQPATKITTDGPKDVHNRTAVNVRDLAAVLRAEPVAPANVWVGWTVENHKRAAPRCDAGIAIPAAVRFVSAEPLLDLPDLRPYLAPELVRWVIVGGESGAKARRFQMEWARLLRDWCGDAGVAFFMKQTGDNHDGISLAAAGDAFPGIPPDLRIREFPA